SWYPRVRLWYGWTNDTRIERQDEGKSKLRAIRDPNAIPALFRLFSADQNKQARLLYVKVLTGIGDARAVDALAAQSLQDESAEVREAAVQAVAKLGSKKALPVYIQALQSDTNIVVNRAAYALGEVTLPDDQFEVVPSMIAALVKTRKVQV